jgi:hypothetical protein
VQLRLSGDDIADALAIHDVRITTAVDDTGRDLKIGPDQQEMMPRAFQGGGPSYRQFTHMAELANPSRNARVIKTIEGEADLLFPTPENGGLVIVKGFLAHPGEPLVDPVLKKSNVSITYLGKEGAETNSDDRMPQPSGRIRYRRPIQGYRLRFSIEDPEHRLSEIAFIDAYGRQIWNGGSSINTRNRTYDFQEEPPSNLRLFVYLATPGAIKTVPFKIENIELP